MAKSRGIALTSEGLEVVRQRMAEPPEPHKLEKKRWSQDDLAERAVLGKKTVQRVLKREAVDRDTIIAIAQALGLEPSSLVDPGDWNVETASIPFEWWRQICETVLEKKRQPNINELLRTDGARFDVEDLFIPLGLVEKKQTRVKRGDIASPEQGSRLYELQQEEVVRRFDRAEEFFETVIQGEQSPRIMIIGEPGAGKTTILQTIATQLPNGVLPVWVSLADLRGCTLDEYLFGGDWLKLADRTLPRETGEEFKQLFKEGRVCLLLDGVDEMAGGRSQLRVIYEQVQGWKAYVRVIMTCRVNVWEAAPLFEKFQVYRNLPLAYPDQVEQYIDNFFRNPALSVQSGEALKQELRSNARVQDAVKNPLRLALLCHSWFSCDGKLPETQAKLYEMFLEEFYKIKREQFDIGPDQQKALNQALGQLALEALDREQSWYRIDQGIAQKILDHPEQPGSLFYQALQLGLLNRIGFVPENPSQECYAFIHPTFQEYLASLSPKIEGWHYFFNHNNEIPNPRIPYQGRACVYRILETRWFQVAYFWLEDSSRVKELNDQIVSDLWQFNPGCCDFGYKETALGLLSGLRSLLSSEIFEGEVYTEEVYEGSGIYQEEYGLCELDERLDQLYPERYSDDNVTGQLGNLLSFEGLVDLDLTDFKEEFEKEELERQRERNPSLFEYLGFFGSGYPDTKSFIEFLGRNTLQENLCNSPLDMKNTSFSQISELAESLSRREIACLVFNFLTHKQGIDVDLMTGISKSPYDDFLECLLWMLNDLQKKFENFGIYEEMLRFLSRKVQDSSCTVIANENIVKIQYLYSLLYSDFYKNFQDQVKIKGKHTIGSIVRYIASLNLHHDVTYHYEHTLSFNDEILCTTCVPQISENEALVSRARCRILDWCSQNLSYSQFYQAWHSSSSVHSELAEYAPIGSTPQTQQLNSQLLDLQTQLTSTVTTYPLCLNLSSLQTLSDRAELCQTLALLSYEAIDPHFDTLEIPENIQNPAQLKTALLKLRKHLQTPNLALILQNSDPTPELLNILTPLTSSFPIAWITNQPLEYPYRSFLPTAANLPQLLQTWLT